MNPYEAGDILKTYLDDYVKSHLDKSKGSYYCCPFCGSGTGRSGTGALKVYPKTHTWTCHACGKTGNIYTLIGKIEGIDGYKNQLKRAAEIYNIEIEWGNPDRAAGQQDTGYISFYREANSHLEETNYLRKRGISKEVADRYMLGYVKYWRHPDVSASVPTSPRLIIPVSNTRYLARDTRNDEEIPEGSQAYKKQRVKSDNTKHFFNEGVLKNPKMPIFVVEGELDALSVIEVGGDAVGLGSTNMVPHFLELLDAWKVSKDTIFIVALDNEENENTKKWEDKLYTGLKDRGYLSYRINPCGESKDCNEALCKDRSGFADTVSQIEENPAFYDGRMKYLQNCTGAHLQEFLIGIRDSAKTPCTPTGFTALDTLLDGGLYPGLYTVGAVTSVGKSTFILQIMDQIAAQGKNVLYFSLEMSRTELIAKSISRNTLIVAQKAGVNTDLAKTTRGILTGQFNQERRDQEKELINAAIAEYARYAENTYIYEGIGNIGVKEVSQIVEEHIRYTGSVPVVIIDYLQILAPYDIRATDKQAVDKSVLELKRLSRDRNVPVIAISSFNRESYKNGSNGSSVGVSLTNFKESGALEYGSDVLIALNPSDEQPEMQYVSDTNLFILKNRNGRKTWSSVLKEEDPITYRYYMLFNYFEEFGRKSENATMAAGHYESGRRRKK